jgi:predicted Zn-dependent protease with MMP-like domain
MNRDGRRPGSPALDSTKGGGTGGASDGGNPAAGTAGELEDLDDADTGSLEVTGEENAEVERMLNEAWSRLEDGDLPAAKAMGARLAEQHGDEAEVLLFLAGCARSEGDEEAALGRLAEAAEADAEWATPLLWSAEIETARGRFEEALSLVRRALELCDEEDEFLDAIMLKADLELRMDDQAASRKTLAELPPSGVLAATPEVALEAAHLHLAGDGVDEAGAIAAAVLAAHEADPFLAADARYVEGMVAEARNDEPAKRAAWLRVRELDEAAAAIPDTEHMLTEAEVSGVAQDAMAELPERARTLLANVPVLIRELPPREDVAEGLDPRLLGLFAGTPLPEDSTLGAGPGLTQIILFRQNLERVATDESTLRAEIRTTLLHETGHFFGLDETELEAMGLG